MPESLGAWVLGLPMLPGSWDPSRLPKSLESRSPSDGQLRGWVDKLAGNQTEVLSGFHYTLGEIKPSLW